MTPEKDMGVPVGLHGHGNKKACLHLFRAIPRFDIGCVTIALHFGGIFVTSHTSAGVSPKARLLNP